MSFIGRALIFAVKEVVQAATHEIGNHLGDATGTLLGRKIDPDHARKDGEKEPEKDSAPVSDDSDDEDESG